MNQNQNKSKHTPGPWTYTRMLIPPQSKDRRCGFVVNGPGAYDQPLPPRICDLRVPSGINGFSEGEANARLIAAAPELLEALREHASRCRDVATILREKHGLINQEAAFLDKTAERMEMEVSKAEGQA